MQCKIMKHNLLSGIRTHLKTTDLYIYTFGNGLCKRVSVENKKISVTKNIICIGLNNVLERPIMSRSSRGWKLLMRRCGNAVTE